MENKLQLDKIKKFEISKLKKIDLKKKNSRVYYARKKNFKISNQNIFWLKKLLAFKKQKILRICFHNHDKEHINEMLIIVRGKYSNKPHKQVKSSVSYHLLQGNLTINIFKKKKIKKKYLLGESKNKLKLLRLNANIFRSLTCSGKFTIFMEMSCGPFKDKDTIWLN